MKQQTESGKGAEILGGRKGDVVGKTHSKGEGQS